VGIDVVTIGTYGLGTLAPTAVPGLTYGRLPGRARPRSMLQEGFKPKTLLCQALVNKLVGRIAQQKELKKKRDKRKRTSSYFLLMNPSEFSICLSYFIDLVGARWAWTHHGPRLANTLFAYMDISGNLQI
jgi:hypothetical protein